MSFRKTFSLVLATLFILTATAQRPVNNYDKAWKKIDSLVNKKGLTQSALEEVNKIYALAKKEKNDAQLIKALLYKMGLQEMKEEDAGKKNIQQLEKEISPAQEPARSILLSITAEMYWNYFQQNRWKLYNRTQTVGYIKDDIATWGIEDFHQKISELFLASIKNAKQLQQSKLEPFDPIIIKGNVRYLRPTLYDLLAHRALNYFRNDERNLTRPAYAFEINQDGAFAPAAEFTRQKFPSLDSASLQHKALLIYQKLIAFHLNDTQPDALIDVDIDRLEFVNQYATVENEDELYQKALQQIADQYGNYPAAAQAWYLLARWHANRAAQYQPLQADQYRYEYVKAREICEKVVANPSAKPKTESEGFINCQNLLNEILQKQLNIQTEKVNIPGQPFRMLVSYRNFTQAHFRLIKLNKKLKEELGNEIWQDEYWNRLVKLPVEKTFVQSLPDTKDNQPHSVEIKVDALSVGEYALLASVDNDFVFNENLLAIQFFHVSAIAYINNRSEFFVLNRESGQPLLRANVQIWYRYYDYTNRRYQQRKGENLLTDQNGHFQLTSSRTGANNNFLVEISTADDHLFMDDENYGYYSNPEQPEREARSTFLFTDRSIYRPGQTIYFKGIMVNRNIKTQESSVIANTKTKLILYDVNGQKTDSVTLTSNEFGSYSGKFTLPENVLNGQFRLEDNTTHSGIEFSVEEYKRPKFTVEIQKPSGTYKLNQEIKVMGIAKAYAGNLIDGAKVKYRVVRKTRWPIWYEYYSSRIWPPHRREEMEIANGETTSNAKGEFSISFKAIPDKSIDKSAQPIFYYEVSADVTDINGETRSGNTSVAVAYQALQLSINIPDQLPADSLKDLRIRSTNLNDLFEKAGVTVTIHKLKTPNRIFRSRYWPQPDQFLMTQEEYYRLFPYDVYKDEDQPAKWEKGEKVFEKTDTTSQHSTFNIQPSTFNGGWYTIEAITKDKYGEEVKAVKYVELTGKENTDPRAFGNIVADKKILEPGDKTSYHLSSNLDSVWLIHYISHVDESSQRNFVVLNKDQKSFDIAVSEADRGGIALDMAFVKHNRVFADNLILQVPYTNKQLSITYATYRDKTLPGSEEKWKVKISGYKTDKVATEMLTAMYDASLDQFKQHSWNIPSLWSKTAYPQTWRGDGGFSAVQSQEKYNRDRGYSMKRFEKNYDQIISYVNSISALQGKAPGINAKKLPMEADGARDMNAAGAPVQNVETLERRNYKKGDVVVTDSVADGTYKEKTKTDNFPVQIRKNFNETAFFFPDLKTDSNSNIEFSFTMPEALTQWKWMSLAHTRNLAFGYQETNIVTQKQLMVQPNPPRFVREGDRMDFSGKIVNLLDKEITGQVELQLIDPTTNQPVDGWFRNFFPNQYFTVPAGQSVAVSFSIEIPFQYNRPVTYKIIAKSGEIGDGEEATLAVVSNRMLVTESLPLNMRGNGSRQFKFDKLLESGNSETLNHHAITVEFTSNPAWYAVQALPYLMEYPYECAEQVFNRYYANALATMIANSSPRIKEIFEKWKTTDTAALLSNLQKNQELKLVLLQETPWVLEARNETEQKKNIALLFDMVRMSRELESSLGKLQDMQSPNGGFVWFKGGPDDRYITQYILTGIGHLKKLNALPNNSEKLNSIIRKAIPYLDRKLREEYDYLIRYKVDLSKDHLESTEIQYLYMRSFFPENAVTGDIFQAYNYYRKQSQQFWLQQGKYMQGMIALSLHRTGDLQTAKEILTSLKQNALTSEEMGMYWKEFNTGGYYWYQSPIESHALLIETFTEVTKNTKDIDDLKTWLLKQKQTQNWRTTKATADACYALLLQGTNWLTNEPKVTIKLGSTTISPSTGGGRGEAGTGYFKKLIDGKQVTPEMGNISVTVSSPIDSTTNRPSNTTAWGAVYWQYFENLDKITTASTPLKLTKKLFVEKNSDRGPVLLPLNDGDVLKVGDKVKVRIELRVDRNMEYVHMKDMRAACMEPVNVISSYKWQGGLGYYETTEDASTNFFFGNLAKGAWVFEYPMFVTHTGTFSNGVTTIQCMYAPEFSSHSEGIKVKVE